MPCHAMHPIQDLFLERFSYVLQIDMHIICAPMLTKFYSCKKWVLHDYRFYNILELLPIRGSQLDRLLGTAYKYLVLT
jgi:uncharacterized membrane protein YfhO